MKRVIILLTMGREGSGFCIVNGGLVKDLVFWLEVFLLMLMLFIWV